MATETGYGFVVDFSVKLSKIKLNISFIFCLYVLNKSNENQEMKL